MSIRLYGVTVELPIYNSHARSLRKVVTAATVGGALFARRDNKVVIRALSNIDLKIEDGDRVALIGGNGAGKTTLLKVIAGIYSPSKGRVEVAGRVSAALNLGLGLEMELSGLENIFLLGYYRGFSRSEVEANLDDIVETADLGTYLQLPVSTYSAGMLGRLTFAVATAFEPDVLLMDEWLLAGDASFMQRASKRTSSFVSRARILVLATHALGVVEEFCDKVLYLSGGRIVAFGPTKEVLDLYRRDTVAVPEPVLA